VGSRARDDVARDRDPCRNPLPRRVGRRSTAADRAAGERCCAVHPADPRLRRSRAATLAALVLLTTAPGCRRRADEAPPPAPTGVPREERDGASRGTEPSGALEPLEGDAGTVRQIRTLQAAALRRPSDLRNYLELARAFVRRARETEDPRFYTQAGDALDRARAVDPRNFEVDQLHALMLLQEHRFREARDVAESALARDPSPHLTYGILSDAELEMGHYDAAVDAAQRMIDARPDAPGYIRAAWLRWLHDDYDGALEVMRLALDALPREPADRAWIVAMMGSLYLARGQLDDAERHFEAARAEYSPSSYAHAGLARVALARGDGARAVTEAEAARAAAPTPEHDWLLGDALVLAGRRADADARYAALERSGRQTDPRTLALFYATNDREHAAAVALARRELTNRADIFTEDALAWALYRNGEVTEARAAAERAGRLHTPDARMLFHAGVILRAAGDTAGAVAALTRALRVNPFWNRAEAEQARRARGELGAPPVPLPDVRASATAAGDGGAPSALARDAAATDAASAARGAPPDARR
jgi:tetratricopeptide (TPR) repeat protein